MPSPPAKTKTLVKQQKATAQKPINVQKIVIKKKKKTGLIRTLNMC